MGLTSVCSLHHRVAGGSDSFKPSLLHFQEDGSDGLSRRPCVSNFLFPPAGLQQRAEIYEIFQTEFQMRLLWGSRGSEGSQSERYEKFDKVLTALSHKLEPPVRHSEL